MKRACLWVNVCTLILGVLLAAQAEAARRSLSKQEMYVLQKVAVGEWADLKARFGEEEENRILSAGFLKNLLNGAYKVHRKGVWIKNAVVVDPFVLENTEVPNILALDSCIFKDRVLFLDNSFQKNLSLKATEFHQEAFFQLLTVHGNLYLANAVFKGPVNFSLSDIKGYFIANGAHFENDKYGANFNSLQVGQSAIFNRSSFKGPVNFTAAEISGYLGFSDLVLEDSVNFTGASIGNQFSAANTYFLNKEKGATFNTIRVRQSAVFVNAIFEGPVDFGSADITGQFNADGARFKSNKSKADFNAIKIGESAFFRNVTFQGPVDFNSIHIEGQFSIMGAQFYGPASFISAAIKGHLSADEAKFLSKGHPAVFEGMSVSSGAVFRDVLFHDDVNLAYCQLFYLLLRGRSEEKQGEASPFGKLDLTGTQIQKELLVENLNLESLEASYMQVKGPATLTGVNVTKLADFQNATIKDLKIRNVQWPENKTNLKLNGLKYISLFVDEPENFQGLMKLVEKSAFNPQNYVQLEDYYERSGHEDWADQIYMAMQDRELAQMSWWNPSRWIVWFFWGVLVGYGRAPLRLFWLSLVIVLLGALLFNPEHMEEEKIPLDGGRIRRLLLRFLISLDQFLPVINMGLAKHWKAKENSYPVWLYFTMEQVLGWILIPIALAAIYIQIK